MRFKLTEEYKAPNIFDPELAKEEVTPSENQIEKEEVIEMTGKELLKIIKDISGLSFDQLNSKIKSSGRFDKLVQQMEEKNKIASPILYYIEGKPVRYDGKHRLFAFAQVVGWITPFPILKVTLKESKSDEI